MHPVFEWLTIIIVAWSTWMTPARGHVKGWLYVYGGQETMIEPNAEYRGVDLDIYNGCGVSAQSPRNMRQIVWIRPEHAEEWYGPCVVIDAASRYGHYFHNVYVVHDIVEISRELAQSWGSDYGMRGEAYFGLCPPPNFSVPTYYEPPLRVDNDAEPIHYSGAPWEEQQYPIDCSLY